MSGECRSSLSSMILGKSHAIESVRQKLICVSSCDVTVLISGESGTGKDLAARAIHSLSRRAGSPFVAVNCSTIPESLFENELFGHRRGAYTDGGSTQLGLVNEAEGGTLFLDEIAMISPLVQAKLLRLLQDKEYKSLGDSRPHKADIRIIAATNRNLPDLIRRGRFMEDLYYRLNIISIAVPPLRERKEDIPVLARHFVKKYVGDYQMGDREIAPEAWAVLESHSWPGNVRELENVIQRAIILSQEPIIRESSLHIPARQDCVINADYPAQILLEELKPAKKKMVQSFERFYLTRLLKENNGRVAQAARKAGKSRTAMWNLLKKHGMSAKDFR